MTASGKIQLIITDIAGDDGPLAGELLQAHAVLADVSVRTIEHARGSLLEFRIIVPSHKAEEMLTGMMKGETEIAIGQIFPNAQMD